MEEGSLTEENKILEVKDTIEPTINWEGLFKDSLLSWIIMAMVGSIIAISVGYLGATGYFNHHKISESRENVTIVEVNHYFGTSLLISGNLMNNSPIEISMPKGCVVDNTWQGKVVNTDVVVQYRPYTDNEFLEFPDLKKLCK